MRLIFSTVCLLLTLTGCHQRPEPNTLVIGSIAGPETELVKAASDEAEKRFGLNVKIVEFNDYNLPNEALNDGSLDANVYQHQPYLDAAIKAHHYDLTVLGKTFLYPMGMYSKQHRSIKTLPNNGTIAIPNDPSNEARALQLLQQNHLITLKTTDMPNVHDILKNPKNFQFKTLDAAQLARVLPDVDAAIINTTFALPAGLTLDKAILLENKNSPYVNLIVIRKNANNLDQLNQFMESFHSEAVKQKAKALFHNTALPGW